VSPVLKESLSFTSRILLIYAAVYLTFYFKENHMDILVLLVLVVLVIGFIVFIIRDAKKGRVSVKVAMKPRKPVVKLELMYPSVLKDDTLHMPVKNVFHAQEVVDGLGLTQVNVGYRRSADGQAIVLYSLDSDKVLRRVQEIV
jgi:hypothetical protein